MYKDITIEHVRHSVGAGVTCDACGTRTWNYMRVYLQDSVGPRAGIPYALAYICRGCATGPHCKLSLADVLGACLDAHVKYWIPTLTNPAWLTARDWHEMHSEA